VKAPFAFQSDEWTRFQDHTFRLTTIRRQGDQDFVRALMAVRLGRVAEAVDVLQPCLTDTMDLGFAGTTIVAKNDAVDRINRLRYDKLPGAAVMSFKTTRSGEQQKDWLRLIPEQVELKEGALVMILANRPYPRLDEDERPEYMYVNGDLGDVVEKDTASGHPLVKLRRTGITQRVAYVTREWKLPTGKRNTKANPTQAWEVKGSVSYMPLRLAYATTVHKSQGLSLDQVQVSIVDPFFQSPGMLYVALSRARTLEGLRIVGNDKTLITRAPTDERVRGWL
jgi:hypothetical protein